MTDKCSLKPEDITEELIEKAVVWLEEQGTPIQNHNLLIIYMGIVDYIWKHYIIDETLFHMQTPIALIRSTVKRSIFERAFIGEKDDNL